MSDHLPECPCQCTCGGVTFWETDGTGKPTHTPSCAWLSPCICDRLRQAEQRVTNRTLAASSVAINAEYEKGYAAGLTAAREAVDAQPSWNYTYGGIPPFVEGPPKYGTWMVKDRALAAIDALRGES